MPRQKNADRRVLGPYEIGNGKWRIVIVDPTHPDPSRRRIPKVCENEDEALRRKALIESDWSALVSATIENAIDQYKQDQQDLGNKETTYKETDRRLRLFFDSVLQRAVCELDEPTCEKLYGDFRARPVTIGKGERARTRTISVDYQRNTLSQAKTFLNWCVGRNWIDRNPMAKVEGRGKRNHGKPQLRIDEADKWLTCALDLADGGDDGAVAALMALLMSNRASEITRRRVRDLDANGTVLWIEDAKTDESEGALDVPEILQPYLRALVKDKKPDDFIFAASRGATGCHWRDWPAENVRRICGLAGVKQVCAHSMRGLSASLAYRKGTLGDQIAAGLRHRDESTTKTSYAKKGAVRAGQQKRMFDQLPALKKRGRRARGKRAGTPPRETS